MEALEIRSIKVENSFVITSDHLDEIRSSEEEIKALKKEGYTIHFKLYDDDKILYYSGYLHESEEDEFAPLDWGMADSGCTEICVRNKATGRYEVI